ncbi:hypothetical protein PO909_016257 [Leuciscus waleckii]
MEADTEDEDSEEEGGPEREGPETYRSKNGEILWSSIPPPQTQGRARAEEIRRNSPGPSRCACVRAEYIKSTFELFFPSSMQKMLLEMTNLEGQRVFGDEWCNVDWDEIQAFIGLLILAGVLKSHHESASSLWDSEMGIFCTTMPLKKFKRLTRILRFDDKRSRAARREKDKLAPIREMWERWVERLPLMYRPEINITVDESLVGFRGRCPFKQYMPKKTAKYGIKIWAACDAKTSYCFNMQVYTGKPPGMPHERNLGKRIVLEMSNDLQGHIVTCDNFFTSYTLGSDVLMKKIKIDRNDP